MVDLYQNYIHFVHCNRYTVMLSVNLLQSSYNQPKMTEFNLQTQNNKNNNEIKEQGHKWTI